MPSIPITTFPPYESPRLLPPTAPRKRPRPKNERPRAGGQQCFYIGLLRSGLDPAEILGHWIGKGDLATCGMVRLGVERGLRIEKIGHRIAAFFDILINIPTTNKYLQQRFAVILSLSSA